MSLSPTRRRTQGVHFGESPMARDVTRRLTALMLSCETELLNRGGLVIDGQSRAAVRADVVFHSDRVPRVGDAVGSPARRVADASPHERTT